MAINTNQIIIAITTLWTSTHNHLDSKTDQLKHGIRQLLYSPHHLQDHLVITHGTICLITWTFLIIHQFIITPALTLATTLPTIGTTPFHSITTLNLFPISSDNYLMNQSMHLIKQWTLLTKLSSVDPTTPLTSSTKRLMSSTKLLVS